MVITAAQRRTSVRPGLDRLVAAIANVARRSAAPIETASLVADVLDRQKPLASLLTPVERAGSPEHAISHVLHSQRDFTISAVVWRPGQTTRIHDHLVWCSFIVLSGAETETVYEQRGNRLAEALVRHRPTGSVSAAAPPDDIHRVSNTGDDIAITLHVYGADLGIGSSVRRTYPDALVAAAGHS